MKLTLRSLGLTGLLLFGTLFALTFRVPGFVEDIGKNFITSKIKEKTYNKIEQAKAIGNAVSKDSKLGQLAAKLYQQNQSKIDELANSLKNKAHKKLAAVVAEMSDLSCECRQKYSEILKQGMEFKLISLQGANKRITEFMKIKYMEVSEELKRDVRIFSASNAVVFLFLLIVSFAKPAAVRHLFLPGMLLFTATAFCTVTYVFGQNWLLTIIYNDYYGFSYLFFIGFVFLILSDIAFNQGTVTCNIVNSIMDALGAAFVPLAPC